MCSEALKKYESRPVRYTEMVNGLPTPRFGFVWQGQLRRVESVAGLIPFYYDPDQRVVRLNLLTQDLSLIQWDSIGGCREVEISRLYAIVLHCLRNSHSCEAPFEFAVAFQDN